MFTFKTKENWQNILLLSGLQSLNTVILDYSFPTLAFLSEPLLQDVLCSQWHSKYRQQLILSLFRTGSDLSPEVNKMVIQWTKNVLSSSRGGGGEVDWKFGKPYHLDRTRICDPKQNVDLFVHCTLQSSEFLRLQIFRPLTCGFGQTSCRSLHLLSVGFRMPAVCSRLTWFQDLFFLLFFSFFFSFFFSSFFSLLGQMWWIKI